MESASDNEIQLDSDRQSNARRYARIRRRMMLVDLVFGAIYIAFWILSGVSLELRQWLDRVLYSHPTLKKRIQMAKNWEK